MEILAEALARATDPIALALLVAGVVVGLLVGALPGIGGVFAMVLLLPLTNGLDTYAVMGLLIGLTSVTTTSDTLPAVLIGVPGSAAAIATVEDGHPLARQGQGDRALGAAYSASMLGGVIGAIVLALAIPVLRPFVLTLRTPDFLAVSVFGLLFVAVVAGKQPLKGVMAALLGVLLSLVGTDPMQGTQRFTFGAPYLWDGLSFSIVFVGLFGLVELADLLKRGSVVEMQFTSTTAGVLRGIGDTIREWRLVLASSAAGTLIGAIPGIGVTTIDWIAYGIASRNRRGGPPYGEGNIRGVIAPESANNAKEGGNLIPTLAIGLPGSVGMIFVLSVLASNGIAPGPKMLTEHLPLVYTIVIYIALANILGTGICLLMTRPLAGLANAPVAFLVPIAVVVLVLGALREHLQLADIVLLAASGAVGLMMKANGWSRAAFALGFMLGPNVERYYFLSSQLNGWSFLTRPAVLVVLAIVVIGAISLLAQRRIRRSHLIIKAGNWGDLLLMALLVGISALALREAQTYSGGSAVFPLLVAGLLGIVALPSLVASFIRPDLAPAGALLRPVSLLGLLMAAATAAIFLFGHIAAAALVVAVSVTLMDRRRWRGALIAAVLTTAMVFMIFDLFQHVSWPRPIVLDWLAPVLSFR